MLAGDRSLDHHSPTQDSKRLREAHRVSDRWSTGRLDAFSDGAFAIAITLLEIAVPEAAFKDLWRGIADQWPSYLAYVTSFVTIGGIWLSHHAIFRRLAQADAMIMRINLLLLMLVSFLPFPTKLVAEALTHTGAESTAIIFYGIVLLGISSVVSLLWRYIASHRSLLTSDVTDTEISAITSRTAPNTGFYALVVVLAILAPHVATCGYLAISFVAVSRSRSDHDSLPRDNR